MSVADTSQPASSPHLPWELVQNIIAQLDPQTDRQSLVALLRVSTATWDCAAPRLYEDVSLRGHALRRLIGGPHWMRSLDRSEQRQLPVLSARHRRALGFIRRLSLYAPMPDSDLFLLWDAAQPNVALFPHVEALSIAPELPSRIVAGASSAPPQDAEGAQIFPGDAVVLFDSPNVCLSSIGAHFTYRSLPCRTVKSFNCHDIDVRTPVSSAVYHQRPREWTSFRLFLQRGSHFIREVGSSLSHWEDFMAETLEGEGEPHPPSIEVSMYLTPEACEKFPAELERATHGKSATTELFHVKCYSDDKTCVPCMVCGKLWREYEGMEKRKAELRLMGSHLYSRSDEIVTLHYD